MLILKGEISMNNLLQMLSKNPMIIVVAVLVLSCVFAIPCILYNKHRQVQDQKFIDDHRGMAFLRISGKKITIDGRDVSQYECIDRTKDNINVALEPGVHTVSALFSAVRSVDYFDAEKILEVNLSLETECQYWIGGFNYSAGQRKNYYNGKVPEHILDLQVGKDFLICYKEGTLENPMGEYPDTFRYPPLD